MKFTTHQLMRLACVSYRQLQYWDEQGRLVPRREGHRRVYDARQAFLALLFRELHERQYSLGMIQTVWRKVRLQRIELPPAGVQRWLLVNVDRVMELAEAETVLAFLEQRRMPSVVIPLHALTDRIESALEDLPERMPPASEGPFDRYASEARSA